MTNESPYSYGPARTYVGFGKKGDRKLQVHFSNGHIQELSPNPVTSRIFAWDYSGSGPNETSAAILSDVLNEPLEANGGYSDRVRDLEQSFTQAFLGDAHHADVKDGFQIPGEIALLWVLNNEPRIYEARAKNPTGVFTSQEAVRSALHGPRTWVRGFPDSLSDVLSREPLRKLT